MEKVLISWGCTNVPDHKAGDETNETDETSRNDGARGVDANSAGGESRGRRGDGAGEEHNS